MSRCPTCGQFAEPPRIARLRDAGFDPLIHCEINAAHFERITPCIGRDDPKVLRVCRLCKIGKALGTWESKRGSYVFAPRRSDESR